LVGDGHYGVWRGRLFALFEWNGIVICWYIEQDESLDGQNPRFRGNGTKTWFGSEPRRRDFSICSKSKTRNGRREEQRVPIPAVDPAWHSVQAS
jgi:hypothetical protein